MKKTWTIRLWLLAAYCVPYVFISVSGDAAFRTAWFYGIPVAGFILLCWLSLRTKNIAVIFLGNILSFASSYGLTKLCGLEERGEYFKPFTSHSLIVAISIALFVVQAFAVLVHALPEENGSDIEGKENVKNILGKDATKEESAHENGLPTKY